MTTGQRGFTLLELLVSLAIFAILGVAAYAGLDAVLNAKDRIEAKADQLGRLQMLFVLMGLCLNARDDQA